jgi:hypothetical protein
MDSRETCACRGQHAASCADGTTAAHGTCTLILSVECVTDEFACWMNSLLCHECLSMHSYHRNRQLCCSTIVVTDFRATDFEGLCRDSCKDHRSNKQDTS